MNSDPKYVKQLEERCELLEAANEELSAKYRLIRTNRIDTLVVIRSYAVTTQRHLGQKDISNAKVQAAKLFHAANDALKENPEEETP